MYSPVFTTIAFTGGLLCLLGAFVIVFEKRSKVMKSRFLLLIGAVVLSGCAAISLPKEASNITLRPLPSVAIEIHRPRLVLKNGQLHLEVYVFRQFEAKTTADSHVDLVFLDAAGSVLLVTTSGFTPRSLARSLRGPQPHAYILVPVLQLPEGTRAIEVRGHDGPHDQPASNPRTLSMDNAR